MLEQWHVNSPRRVEALVHEKLAPYRVNPRREFFVVKYDHIRRTIEQAIQDLAAGVYESGTCDGSPQ